MTWTPRLDRRGGGSELDRRVVLGQRTAVVKVVCLTTAVVKIEKNCLIEGMWIFLVKLVAW